MNKKSDKTAETKRKKLSWKKEEWKNPQITKQDSDKEQRN